MLKQLFAVPLAVLVLVGAGCQSSTNPQTQVNTNTGTNQPSQPSRPSAPTNTGAAGGAEVPMFRSKGKATVKITGDLPYEGTFDAECGPDLIEANKGIKYGILPPMKEVAPGQMALPWQIYFNNTSHRVDGEQNLRDSDVQYGFTTRNTKGQIVAFEADKATSRLVFSNNLKKMTFSGDLKGFFNDLKGHADITVTCN